MGCCFRVNAYRQFRTADSHRPLATRTELQIKLLLVFSPGGYMYVLAHFCLSDR